MDEEKRSTTQPAGPDSEALNAAPEAEERPSGPRNGKERLYENFRGVPIWVFDVIIGLCVAAFAAILILGALHII